MTAISFRCFQNKKCSLEKQELWSENCVSLQILTKDSVTVAVDAVVYYRISNPRISVVNVENAARSTQLLAQTTLRNILGTKTLSEILTDRESVSAMMQVSTAAAAVRRSSLAIELYLR